MCYTHGREELTMRNKQIDDAEHNYTRINSLRLHLDVDIGGFDIELSSMRKQTSIENELQYQICCLDASEIAGWN